MAGDGVAQEAAKPGSRLAPNVHGALWMLASALTFTVMMVMVRYLGHNFPIPVQTFYRQLAGLIVLAPFILKRGLPAFATKRPWVLCFRSGTGTIALMLSFYAFQKLPLAEANALSFTRALWLVPLAAIVVKERIGLVRIAAVLAGFGGVLLMIRPAHGMHFVIDAPTLAMLVSGLMMALTIVSVKVMTRDHSPMVIVVWAAFLGVIFALPPALFVWRWPNGHDLVLLALLGVIATFSQACFVKGIQLGEAAIMASMDYTRLLFGALIGYLLFAEVPGPWTWAGAAVIVASTLFITLREQQLARRAVLEGETLL